MNTPQLGKSQETAAAKAAISERSGRCKTAWKNGQGIRENSVENCPP